MSDIDTVPQLPSQERYIPSRLNNIEDLELYRLGGYHPVSIGDVFANGRYKVLHKLGSGGFSTVWLARDQLDSSVSGSLVSLKILCAEDSPGPNDELPALSVPLQLENLLRTVQHPAGHHVQVIQDHFMVEGPNGTHLCLVYPFAGPNVLSMAHSPGRVAGSKRLRADLVRKMAKQAATVLEFMHPAGFVHGDLTTSNILLQVSDQVRRWSDDEIYHNLGNPVTEKVRTCDGSPLGRCAPREAVAPVDRVRFSSLPILQEDIIVIDFGQSFSMNSPPKDYVPGTLLHYESPEARFENKITAASDTWALACTIFEMRSGESLFDSFFCSDAQVLNDTVQTLGKLPEPWWSAFEGRKLYFEENGEPRPVEVQKRAGVRFLAIKTSIREMLRKIGEGNVAPEEDEGPMIEATGMRLDEEEVSLLGDLLEKMLRYRPEERITIQEVLEHPWFRYTDAARGGGPAIG